MLDKNKNKILSNKAGFTLVELLASIFIIALISAVFMVNYNNTSKRSQLKMAAQKLASDIRLAQNYSLGSKTYNQTDTPPGGWGVHFDMADTSHYIIFADKNTPFANKTYDEDEGEAIEIKTLPAGIVINRIYAAENLTAQSVNIVFFPPDPEIYINTSSNAYARVILKENINNSTAEVTVNPFGLIDIDSGDDYPQNPN